MWGLRSVEVWGGWVGGGGGGLVGVGGLCRGGVLVCGVWGWGVVVGWLGCVWGLWWVGGRGGGGEVTGASVSKWT